MNEKTISLIDQRKIEAEIAEPLINGFALEMGKEKAFEIAGKVIRDLAKKAGRDVSKALGADDMAAFAGVVKDMWAKNNALEIKFLEQTPEKLAFDVIRCRYYEQYEKMGITDYGFCLSCNRDGAFCRGFNPRIIMKRTTTLMQGGPCCDFRFFLDSGQ